MSTQHTQVQRRTPRFAERFDCGSRAAADRLRERFPDCLHEGDDAREKTVLISESIPPGVRAEIASAAARSWERERTGTADLTPFEKSELDFAQTNIFHAQTCKAIATEAGVDDWMAHYDVSLTTDEHRSIYQRVGGSDVTMRDIPYVTGGDV